MERRIYEAAVEGSVIALLNLLQEDPIVLDRYMVGCYPETLLHIASMLGHDEFVREILSRKPELARELDSRRSSPLHLATAKGYLGIVKDLVLASPEMCCVRDLEGRTPLHIAAIKGHLSVLMELAKLKAEAARILMDRSETILHVCVRYNQLEAMKLLVEITGDHEFVNSKDDGGNTILHLAVADKQVEAIKFLMTNNAIEVNAVNESGFTALDILTQSRRDLKDLEIAELLRRRGAINAKDIQLSIHELVSTQTRILTSHDNNQINLFHPKAKGTESNFIEKKDDWLKDMNNTLMVVASLIATVTFQAGLNPPGGVWQDSTKVGAPTSEPQHEAGLSVMATNDKYSYDVFFVFNTTGFLASLFIILLLVSGLPFCKRKFFTWILMVIVWVAISAITMAYLYSVTSLINDFDATEFYAPATVVYTWIGLMIILLLTHTIRLIIKMIKYLRKLIRRRREASAKNSNGYEQQYHCV